MRLSRGRFENFKAGKSSGLDGVATEYVKLGGNTCGKWLVRIFRVCINFIRFPVDWRVVCIILLYREIGHQQDCGKN